MTCGIGCDGSKLRLLTLLITNDATTADLISDVLKIAANEQVSLPTIHELKMQGVLDF